MGPKGLIILNPEARNRWSILKKYYVGHMWQTAARARSSVLEFYAPTSPEHTHNLLELYRANGLRFVGIIGGDGTHSDYANYILNNYSHLPLTWFINGGSACIMAQELGYKHTASGGLEAMIKCVESASKGETCVDWVNLRLLKMYIDDCPEPTYAFTFAAGYLMPWFQRYYVRNKACNGKRNKSPKFSALRTGSVSAKAVASLALNAFTFGHLGRFAKELSQPRSVRISADGTEFEKDHKILIISQHCHVSHGLSVVPPYPLGMGEISVYMNNLALNTLKLLPASLRHRPLPLGDFYRYKDFTIDFGEPTLCTIDGELITATKMHVTSSRPIPVVLGPRPMEFNRNPAYLPTHRVNIARLLEK